MTAPSWLRRLRTYFSDVQTRRLRVQLTDERDRNRALEQRLANLQAANVGAYHALAIERGAACVKADCPLCKDAAKAGAA